MDFKDLKVISTADDEAAKKAAASAKLAEKTEWTDSEHMKWLLGDYVHQKIEFNGGIGYDNYGIQASEGYASAISHRVGSAADVQQNAEVPAPATITLPTSPLGREAKIDVVTPGTYTFVQQAPSPNILMSEKWAALRAAGYQTDLVSFCWRNADHSMVISDDRVNTMDLATLKRHIEGQMTASGLTMAGVQWFKEQRAREAQKTSYDPIRSPTLTGPSVSMPPPAPNVQMLASSAMINQAIDADRTGFVRLAVQLTIDGHTAITVQKLQEIVTTSRVRQQSELQAAQSMSQQAMQGKLGYQSNADRVMRGTVMRTLSAAELHHDALVAGGAMPDEATAAIEKVRAECSSQQVAQAAAQAEMQAAFGAKRYTEWCQTRLQIQQSLQAGAMVDLATVQITTQDQTDAIEAARAKHHVHPFANTVEMTFEGQQDDDIELVTVCEGTDHSDPLKGGRDVDDLGSLHILLVGDDGTETYLSRKSALLLSAWLRTACEDPPVDGDAAWAAVMATARGSE